MGDCQQRDCVNLVGLRHVLQHLDEVIAVDDFARRARDVRSDLEGAGVDLAGPSSVVEHIVESCASRRRAAPAGVERLLEHGRVGQQQVRGGERVGEHDDREARLHARRLVQLRGRQQVIGEPPQHQVAMASGVGTIPRSTASMK